MADRWRRLRRAAWPVVAALATTGAVVTVAPPSWGWAAAVVMGHLVRHWPTVVLVTLAMFAAARWRADRRQGRPDRVGREPRWMWLLSDAGIVTAVVTVAGLGMAAMAVLLDVAQRAAAQPVELAKLRIEAIKYGLGTVAAGGAAAALLLALRRQRHAEQAQNHTEADAVERRVTELYTAAAQQLGHDQAAVRLAGLYALERLAQDNPAHRQTVVDVFCAYLRMPITPSPDPSVNDGAESSDTTGVARADVDPAQERQVRLTAQRILTGHLQPPASPDNRRVAALVPNPASVFWPDIDLDLTGAVLLDWHMPGGQANEALFTGATFTGDTWFSGATFTGNAGFIEAAFTGPAQFDGVTFGGATFGGAWFAEARFGGPARFDEATFHHDAGFGGATFGGPARFDRATFTGDAWFRQTTFHHDARFDRATFTAEAWFDKATFTGPARFRRTTFTGGAGFGETRFAADAGFTEATFHRDAGFTEATFHRDAGFTGVTFTGPARFDRAAFGGAWFAGTTFTDTAGFVAATFTGDAGFGGARFTGPALFDKATFGGDILFEEATFTGDAWFDKATITGRARFYQATFLGGARFECVRVAVREGRRDMWPPGWSVAPEPVDSEWARLVWAPAGESGEGQVDASART